MNSSAVVSLEQVSVHYEIAGESIHALESVSLTILPGTSTSVVGRSGSGKSTLVSVLSLLRRPSRGTVLVGGRDSATLRDSRLSELRASSVGTVFQSFHLDPGFTASANVLLPWYFSTSLSKRQARQRSEYLLDTLGIPELADRYPGQMSGGQRQRVAIARALFPQPSLLLADEPTGNLDEDTAAAVAEVIYSLPEVLSTAVVIVTHDEEIAAKARYRIAIVRGSITHLAEQPPHRTDTRLRR